MRPVSKPSVFLFALVVAFLGMAPIGPSVTPAGASGPTPPVGAQHVLVIPIEFPSCNGCSPSPGDARFCPDTTVACPAGPYLFAPPRHSPAQWESIFNTNIGPFFNTVSYGQLSFDFTVLNDPQTSDGWFPAPHAVQLYQGGNWGAKAPQLPYAADTASSVIDNLCGNFITALALGCGHSPTSFPHNYDRLVILNNWQAFGGQTNDNGVPYTFSTSTVGNMSITSTVTNESWSDQTAYMTLEHELGHQLGMLSHYGDCAWYPPPYIGGTPQKTLDCLGEWDMMSYTYCSGNNALPPTGACSPPTQFGGYSRYAMGWINPALTVAHDIVGEGPFTQTVQLGPLELPPAPGRPNLIRLSEVPLDWSGGLGYDVECREKTNGDNGIPDAGVIVTSIHEFSVNDLMHPAPADHVMRAINPDTISTAMHPGDVFTDKQLGLSVRFDKYVNDDAIAPAQRCQVSIANLEPLPKYGYIGLQFAAAAQNLHAGTGLSNDLTFAKALQDPAIGPPTPVDPPWSGHDNPIFVQVHNFQTSALKSINARVGVSPGVFTSYCGATPPGKNVKIGALSTLGAASGAGHYLAPTNTNAVVMTAVVKGKGSPVSDVQSGFAFQFHDGTGAPQTTTFSLSAGHACHTPQTFMVTPIVPPGWNVNLSSTMVTLRPGQSSPVQMTVTAPAADPAGGPTPAVQIPVELDRVMPMNQAAPSGVADGCFQFSFCQTLHLMPFATLNVIARVVGAAATTTLRCPGRVNVKSTLNVDAGVSVAGGTTLVEFVSPSRRHFSEVATFDPASGRYVASMPVKQKGTWTVTSRWGGDDTHAPVEAPACTVNVTSPFNGG